MKETSPYLTSSQILDTPVSAFMKLRELATKISYSKVSRVRERLARYSFLGFGAVVNGALG